MIVGLRNVKKNLLENLRNCETRECKEVEKEYEIGRLDQNDIEYDQVNFKLPFSLFKSFVNIIF